MKLFEIKKPSKVKSKTSRIVDIPWEDDSPGNLPAASNQQSDKSPKVLGKSVDASTTKAKTSNINLPDSAKLRLSDFLANSPDEADAPEESTTAIVPVTPQTIPDTLKRSLANAGTVVPEWHMVANLPGNMREPIRRLGKAIFSQYTNTPTDQIQMIGNLGGQGPNAVREINAVANWVVTQGEEVTSGQINFDNIMPGYVANIKVYNAEGVQVMLVTDEYGQYIYAWPVTQSKISDMSNQPKTKSLGN